jgi:transposase
MNCKNTNRLQIRLKRKRKPRKLAVIIWNMVVNGTPYHNPEGYLFLDQKRKLGLVKRIKKQIDKFGLTNEELELSMT